MVEDVGKDISGLTLSVPRPRNLHWSPQSNRVYNNSVDNNFHESPKQLKSGARLRLGDDETSRSRKKINFKSNSMKPIASISSRNIDRTDRHNPSTPANKEKADSMKGEEDKPICDICQVQSSSRKKLERHKKLCHDISNPKSSSSYRCYQCKRSFNQFAKLLIHKYSHNKGRNGSVCNVCKSRYSDINQHNKERHLSEELQSIQKIKIKNEVILL